MVKVADRLVVVQADHQIRFIHRGSSFLSCNRPPEYTKSGPGVGPPPRVFFGTFNELGTHREKESFEIISGCRVKPGMTDYRPVWAKRCHPALDAGSRHIINASPAPLPAGPTEIA
ncbi:MAG: hypothetical protein EPO63_08760 [Candidatus Nitrosotenuis sp.]|nr:MAG: hypothetical protein EPO63_08760 [Candidatus Nitrosotenuis sp.]